jgi:FADH2 O2-dependent halogenase
LATFEDIHSKISASCGLKESFGFIYHRPDSNQDPSECIELTNTVMTNPESHLFRQDIDARLLAIAIHHGANIEPHTNVTDFDFDDDGVTVKSDSGQTWRCRFVIDASGFRSPLARKLDLREQPTRLRHHARSLFTHMVDVPTYDDVVFPRGAHGNRVAWNRGTLHHVFEGGWIWVIPFNNHTLSRNSLTSVGLSVDPRIHPKPDCPPEEEFRKMISRFPEINSQFASSRAVRQWVSTDRLQYSSTRTVGYRWCLSAHAAGFVDALFSRGLTDTLDGVHALGWRLLDALREDDFSVGRFEPVHQIEQARLANNDALVASAYTSFQNYDLFSAWLRVWISSQIFLNLETIRACQLFHESRNTKFLDRLERVAMNSACPDYSPDNRLFWAASDELQQVAEGHQSAAEAATRVMRLLKEADCVPPALELDNAENRIIRLMTGTTMVKTLRWANMSAPAEVRQIVNEGIRALFRLRVSPSQFNHLEELRHRVAAIPVLAKALR